MTELLQRIGGRPIDLAVLPAANRRKKLLIADMDSTMIGQECIDELGLLAGVGPKIMAITARAMTGEIDFEAALRERLAFMAGLESARISEIIDGRLTFTPGGPELIATMKSHGARTALVSGGFVQFTSHVAQRLGFDEHRANELLFEDGKLTGKAREPILGQGAKLEAFRQITAEMGISAEDVISVGDGANDIPMLTAAGLGVAFRAKPKVKASAKVVIDRGDLTALLYLQGYRREEFAAPI